MACLNPHCRHRTKRKLRPLVITLDAADRDGDDDDGRRARIARLFASHPSLAAHFAPPAFSPGVPSRDLRNRRRLLEHARAAGLVGDVEWEALRRAAREEEEEGPGPADGTGDDGSRPAGTAPAARGRPADPFKYLVATERVAPGDGEAGPDAKVGKAPRRPSHRTTALVPVSPCRRGSAEDVALPYSVELWRKAKTLNRDRSVLACVLAHLVAMRRLVEGRSGVGPDDGPDEGFDFILEDNVRAFVGTHDDSAEGRRPGHANEWTGWSCECANRIWDAMEASAAAPSSCHLRYLGWLGSAPNLTWVYERHVPRSAFNAGAVHCDGSRVRVFPFPTNEDFELDSIVGHSKSTKPAETGTPQNSSETGQAPKANGEAGAAESKEEDSTPDFATPGGTAVWGAFAYSISPAAYRSLRERLRHDVGALVWRGKRMRAYRAKPIDKVLPRHVRTAFGRGSVHLPDRPAFVRAPMLGSLLHARWEAGFCGSTERQHALSRGEEDAGGRGSGPSDPGRADGVDVWDRVWLTDDERNIVEHRRNTGMWARKSDIAADSPSDDAAAKRNSHSSLRAKASVTIPSVVSLAVLIGLASVSLLLSAKGLVVPLMPRYAADAFVFNTHIQRERWTTLMGSGISEDDLAGEGERRRAKLGKVSIISRQILVEVDTEQGDDETGKDTTGLNVTVWEMDKPAELIQEWWSIDSTERKVRMKDPFGVVMWPGSILASREMMRQHYAASRPSALTDAVVLVLGAGTGVEAQTAALLGARKVVATDVNPLTLQLLDHGARNDDRIGDTIEARHFDLFSRAPLPPCDLLVAADVLYNAELAEQVGRRLHEAIVRSFEEGAAPAKVIVTDSQRFHGTNFLDTCHELRDLNALFAENGWETLAWETHTLKNVHGSGVLVDEDQVYDVEARMIRWGWQQ